jgi:osmoprotectant transport system permease protein
MGFFRFYIANINDIINAIQTHLFIFAVALTGAIIIGITLSIIITSEGKEKIGRIILSVMGAAQSIPSIVVISIVFIFVGIGIKPTIIALVFYSLVPIIFNATSGLLSVPYDVIDAGKGIGYTNSQILWKIKMPIALPIIIGGIRSSATIIVGSATAAAVIGGGGLGDFIFIGLRVNRIEMLLVGALTVAILALVIDAIIGKIETKIVPKGLK